MNLNQLAIRGHLQDVSLKFTSPELINTQIAHILPMPTRQAKVLTYNRGDQFRDEAKPRERGTEAALADWKYTMADVNTAPVALKARVTDEDLQDEGLPAGTVPPVNMQQDALELVAWKLDLNREIKLAQTIFAQTWADGVAGGTDVAGAWAPTDNTNTFLSSMETALAAFVAGGVPLDHVRLMLDYKTLARLGRVAEINDRIKYTSSKSLTAESLAALLNIEKVVEAKAIVSTAKEKVDGTDFAGSMIWEKNAGKGSAFLYYYPPAPGRKTLATLYQPRHKQANGQERISKAYRTETIGSWEFESQENVGVHVAAKPAGYLWVDTLVT